MKSKVQRSEGLRERMLRWLSRQDRVTNKAWITKDQALAIAERYLVDNGWHQEGSLFIDGDRDGYRVWDGYRGGITIGISGTGEILEVVFAPK